MQLLYCGRVDCGITEILFKSLFLLFKLLDSLKDLFVFTLFLEGEPFFVVPNLFDLPCGCLIDGKILFALY